MICPYCVSDIPQEAAVCRVCKRDLYLLKPLMLKVAELESSAGKSIDTAALEARIAQLEQALANQAAAVIGGTTDAPQRFLLRDIFAFLIVPLAILLIAHVVLTIVYDAPLIYLRLVSMIVPLPFGFWLFRRGGRKFGPWFTAAFGLACASVIGMSTSTSLVDHTPVWPQSAIEWREVLEYSASISFSFLAGMVLGGLRYRHQARPATVDQRGWSFRLASLGASRDLSLETIQTRMKTVSELGATTAALGATAASLYTGLKGVLGS